MTDVTDLRNGPHEDPNQHQRPPVTDPEHFATIASQILAALNPRQNTESHMADRAERTVDFRPTTHPGWGAHFVDAAGEHWSTPIAGWLIRDEHALDADGDFLAPAPGYVPYRFAVAAICAAGVIEPVTDIEDFWFVTDPSDSEPTAEQIETQAKTRRRDAATRRARLETPSQPPPPARSSTA